MKNWEKRRAERPVGWGAASGPAVWVALTNELLKQLPQLAVAAIVCDFDTVELQLILGVGIGPMLDQNL